MGDSFSAALCAGQRRNLPPHKKVLGEGEGLGGREGEAACPLYGGSPERFLPSPKRESTGYSFFTSAYHALACSRSLVARLAKKGIGR